MSKISLLAAILLVPVGLVIGAPQKASDNRHAYLGLIFHVRPADAEKFVQSNRQYAMALAAHSVSDPRLRWTAYADDSTYTFLWLYPIAHLNDIEELSKVESTLGERITAEGWNAGSDLHDAVEYTEEFVIRDEPSLSRLPEDTEAWMHQHCEFQLYYTAGGYGGSDSQVREMWRKYLAAFPQKANNSHYRILRVLIGLERPLWVVQRCGANWEQIRDQESEEVKLTGASGVQAQRTLLKLVRRVVVWQYDFDSGMSYPISSTANQSR